MTQETGKFVICLRTKISPGIRSFLLIQQLSVRNPDHLCWMYGAFYKSSVSDLTKMLIAKNTADKYFPDLYLTSMVNSNVIPEHNSPSGANIQSV